MSKVLDTVEFLLSIPDVRALLSKEELKCILNYVKRHEHENPEAVNKIIQHVKEEAKPQIIPQATLFLIKGQLRMFALNKILEMALSKGANQEDVNAIRECLNGDSDE